MANPRLVRTILGFLWFASAVVVLGISSVGANNDRKANTYRPVIALNLATASLTIIYELIGLPGRFILILRGILTALATEAAITLLLWILWLATATAYTVETEATRELCSNLDLLPQAIIEANDLVKTCRTYKANLAFAWIAFGLATTLLLYTVYTAVAVHWTASFGDASRRAAPASTVSAARVEAKANEQPAEAPRPSGA